MLNDTRWELVHFETGTEFSGLVFMLGRTDDVHNVNDMFDFGVHFNELHLDSAIASARFFFASSRDRSFLHVRHLIIGSRTRKSFDTFEAGGPRLHLTRPHSRWWNIALSSRFHHRALQWTSSGTAGICDVRANWKRIGTFEKSLEYRLLKCRKGYDIKRWLFLSHIEL